MVDLKFVLRRITFANEIRGIISKIDFAWEELISMTFHIRPKGRRKIIWKGEKKDLIISYYDSIVCWRAEILDDGLYNVKLDSDEPLILDIGANQGFFTLWMKYNYPSARIFAYEPMEKSFDILVRNIADNEFKNVYPIHAGIDKETCVKPIYHTDGGAGLGDSVVDDGLSEKVVEECQFINPDESLKEYKSIDLIKIDAEGAEYSVITGTKFWKKAKNLIIEFHDNYKGIIGDKDLDYVKAVEKAGFKLVKRTGTPQDVIYVCYFEK